MKWVCAGGNPRRMEDRASGAPVGFERLEPGGSASGDDGGGVAIAVLAARDEERLVMEGFFEARPAAAVPADGQPEGARPPAH